MKTTLKQAELSKKLHHNIYTGVEHKQKQQQNTLSVEDVQAGLAVYSGIALTGMFLSHSLTNYIFFGSVSLIGLVAIAESYPNIKAFLKKHTKLIDISLFISTVYAIFFSTVTITGMLTIFGLGYTLTYSRWLKYSR